MTVELDALTCLRSYRSLKLDALAKYVGCSRREAEEAVQTLRMEGHAIVGGNDGLRLTTDPVELASYLAARRRRLITQYKGTRALRRSLRRMEERTALTLFGDAA